MDKYLYFKLNTNASIEDILNKDKISLNFGKD